MKDRQISVVEAREDEIYDIELEESLLAKNKEIADRNKQRLDDHKVLGIDVMGSVGAGKTSLITQLVTRLRGRRGVQVIAGDLTTTIDAECILAAGGHVIQVNTGKECHLDANLVARALDELDLGACDVLLIENVGNLICPGEFPLGAHKRVVVVSVTEGPYIVVKHPYIFLDADLVVINKIDLADATKANLHGLATDVTAINPGAKVICTNCMTGVGIGDVADALGLLP